MNTEDVSNNNRKSDKDNKNIDSKLSNTDIEKNIDSKLSNTDNNSKISKISKPNLIRRNAIANFDLLESYQEFIKHYNETEKKK